MAKGGMIPPLPTPQEFLYVEVFHSYDDNSNIQVINLQIDILTAPSNCMQGLKALFCEECMNL